MEYLIEAFKKAWHDADGEGKEGSRVEAGLKAVLPEALSRYSEWLDGEGLVRDEYESGDTRSHDDLVTEHMRGAY